MPFFISTLMTSTTRRAMRLASSETVMVSGMVMSRGPAGPAGCCLMALVDALQMAAIGGDRARALVIAFQRARDGELAAAALAFAGLLGRAAP